MEWSSRPPEPSVRATGKLTALICPSLPLQGPLRCAGGPPEKAPSRGQKNGPRRGRPTILDT